MNSDFVLVRGEAQRWYWQGRNLWGSSLEEAKVLPTREAAEKAIRVRQAKGQWGSVGYLTVEEAREGLGQ